MSTSNKSEHFPLQSARMRGICFLLLLLLLQLFNRNAPENCEVAKN